MIGESGVAINLEDGPAHLGDPGLAGLKAQPPSEEASGDDELCEVSESVHSFAVRTVNNSHPQLTKRDSVVLEFPRGRWIALSGQSTMYITLL